MSDQVVIVGGGLAGLVTAYELGKQGVSSVVLERSERVGGRVCTLDFPDGATAESCMEEIWESSPAYGLLRELDLPVVEQPAHSSVVVGGRLIPFRASDGGRSYFDDLCDGEGGAGFRHWNQLLTGLLQQLSIAQRTGEWSASLTALGRQGFGRFVDAIGLSPRMREWIRTVVESETATGWNRITALDAVAEMAPFVLDESSGRGETNARVIGGNQRLVERLLRAVGEETVRLGATVRRVVDSGYGDASVHYVDALGRSQVERGHHVVLTPPLWALGSIHLEPGLDRLSRAAIATGAAGSYVKVVLRVRPDGVRMWERDGEHPFTLLTSGPTGCVYLTDGRPAGRDHVVTMLIHGRFARHLTGRSSREILARSVGELDRLMACPPDGRRMVPLFTGLGDSVSEARVFDHPKAVAYWPRALGRSRFDSIADALRAPHGRILIGGDSTDSSHSDGAVRAGQRMASAIVGATVPGQMAVR